MDRVVFNVLYMLDLHAMPLILLKITFQKLYCIMLNNYMTIFFGWRKYMSKNVFVVFPDLRTRLFRNRKSVHQVLILRSRPASRHLNHGRATSVG